MSNRRRRVNGLGVTVPDRYVRPRSDYETADIIAAHVSEFEALRTDTSQLVTGVWEALALSWRFGEDVPPLGNALAHSLSRFLHAVYLGHVPGLDGSHAWIRLLQEQLDVWCKQRMDEKFREALGAFKVRPGQSATDRVYEMMGER